MNQPAIVMKRKKIMEDVKSFFKSWWVDILNGVSWAAVLSWLKYFLTHFVDIGWSVACCLITMYASHLFGKRLKRKK